MSPVWPQSTWKRLFEQIVFAKGHVLLNAGSIEEIKMNDLDRCPDLLSYLQIATSSKGTDLIVQWNSAKSDIQYE